MNIIDNYPIEEAQTLISQMMNLIILFEQQIENLKEKLCGFDDFSVQIAFAEIDLESRGYIVVQDMRTFLNNKIFARDIELLFYRHGNLQRLPFLGFLRIIKPHSNKKLAQDIASRNIKNILNPQYKELLVEILTLTLVMIGQLQTLKLELANKYCLNPAQIRRLIFGKNLSTSQMKDIMKFMKSSGFDVSQSKFKMIEAYTNSKIELYDDLQMHLLFLPTHFKSTYQLKLATRPKLSSIPINTRANYFSFKYPNAQYIHRNQSYPEVHDNQSRIRDDFKINSRRQNSRTSQQNPYQQYLRNNQQTKANTPFLDLFLKSSSSQKFLEKSPQKYNSIKQSSFRSSNSPKNISALEPISKYSPVPKLSSPLAPMVIHNFYKESILEDFLKSNRSREKFNDSVSQGSNQAFKYV